LGAQNKCELYFAKQSYDAEPGKVLNVAYFVKNQYQSSVSAKASFILPKGWKIVTQPGLLNLAPNTKQFQVLSLQVPSNYNVGEYTVKGTVSNIDSKELVSEGEVIVRVQEVEKVNLQVLHHPDHVFAGENITANFLVQNMGNTTKKIFLETQNCDVDGAAEVELKPGESKTVKVTKFVPMEYEESIREYYTVRAIVSGQVLESINKWVQIFPSKKLKKDMFYRFPVTASVSYLAANQQEEFESTYQFEVSGQGALDLAGKHQLEFLARGPNNTNLSFLGLYDQYYVSYSNGNLSLFAGQKSFSFTPLTESSRFGLGAEVSIALNNGLAFGYKYVQPRFFEEIENEMASFVRYSFGKENNIDFFYITKKYSLSQDHAQLASLNSQLKPFRGTSLDLEFSRGYFAGKSDNAYRFELSSQFSIFNVSANYYSSGKYYPGYYNNSKFYSGSVSARLSKKLSIGGYAKEDFLNAQLDTFFVTAPYSKSFQAYLNYNINSQTHLKLYLRDYERKDRLSLNKFHYRTRSVNSRINQRFKKLNYSITGEIGRSKNYLLESGEDEQTSYRMSADIGYRINSKHTVRTFGTWSNINQFVSGGQQNVTAGLSASSQLTKQLRTNLYVQNTYDIDDYYKNRNLMQFDLEYTFLKKHSISVQSFYTIFKTEVDDAEFTMSATYKYNFGVPIKRIIKAGKVKGVVTSSAGEPVEGIWIKLVNQTTITDDKGEYEFDYVSPGKHLVFVDEKSFELDEITNVANPLEIDVFEDQATLLDIKITKGARIRGVLTLGGGALQALKSSSLDGIVIELVTRVEEYRLTSDENGRFDFPMVRPGKVELKIYASSLPSGYKLGKPIYNYQLQPGEEKELQIELPSKTQNIIFKSQNIPVLKKNGGVSKLSKKPSSNFKKEQKTKPYYSLQIGAFGKQQKADAAFFKGEQFYFEKQIDNLHKYFIGKFDTLSEAKAHKKLLKDKFRNAFIVVFENNKAYSVEEFESNSK